MFRKCYKIFFLECLFSNKKASTTTTPIAKQCIGTTKSKAPNTSKDWRLLDAVTPIKNQGSCNAWYKTKSIFDFFIKIDSYFFLIILVGHLPLQVQSKVNI